MLKRHARPAATCLLVGLSACTPHPEPTWLIPRALPPALRDARRLACRAKSVARAASPFKNCRELVLDKL